MNEERTIYTPRVRGPLKGWIYTEGYKTIQDFSHSIGMNPAQLSRILNGWIWPSGRAQRLIADGLGLTLRELRELL